MTDSDLIPQLLARFDAAQPAGRRRLVALAGGPASGKSTLAETLADASAVEVAGSDGEGNLSYRALDQWSDRIAAQLRGEGIEVGSVVAIRLPRSPAFIAAIFGVLKCGAAFVPVDPSYPDAV